jgi:hypothetical protein
LPSIRTRYSTLGIPREVIEASAMNGVGLPVFCILVPSTIAGNFSGIGLLLGLVDFLITRILVAPNVLHGISVAHTAIHKMPELQVLLGAPPTV